MAFKNWQADGSSRRPTGFHQYLKRAKRRHERRKAKRNPDCQATYTRYYGYEL